MCHQLGAAPPRPGSPAKPCPGHGWRPEPPASSTRQGPQGAPSATRNPLRRPPRVTKAEGAVQRSRVDATASSNRSQALLISVATGVLPRFACGPWCGIHSSLARRDGSPDRLTTFTASRVTLRAASCRVPTASGWQFPGARRWQLHRREMGPCLVESQSNGLQPVSNCEYQSVTKRQGAWASPFSSSSGPGRRIVLRLRNPVGRPEGVDLGTRLHVNAETGYGCIKLLVAGSIAVSATNVQRFGQSWHRRNEAGT